jgi:hypothetical protein
MASHLTSLVAAGLEENSKVFHLFPELPPDLRYKFWPHFLENTTPEMYIFTLRYPRAISNLVRSRKPGRRELLMSAEVFLRPLGHTDETNLIRSLKYSIAAYRTAFAICVQARQAVLEMFPDTLTFRDFPKTWRRKIDRKNNEWTSPDTEGYPARILRFNSAQEVIVFEIFPSILKDISTMSAATGKVPENFLNIRHIGFTVSMFDSLYKPILDFTRLQAALDSTAYV